MNKLDDFNQLPSDVAAAELLSVCHSTRWAAQVAQSRPFADLAAAQKVADEVWQSLGPDEWRAALDGHPRIGEQGGTSQAFSRQEQAGMTGVADRVKAAIAEGNRVYEERFGHVFLISAAGRTPEEILTNLHERLDNDPGTELVVAAEQHRRITRLRLEKLLG